MSRNQFQSGPATDHYHNGLGPNHDPAGGGAISVTDGTTTVAAATGLRVPDGTLADAGGGVANIATASAIYVSADDPGAVGARNLWVQISVGGNDGYTQVWVRNDANDAWGVISPVVNSDGTTQVLLTSPSDVAELNLADGAGSYLTGHTNLALIGGNTSLFLDSTSGVHLGATAGGPALLFGSANPHSGAGVAAPIGSLHLGTGSGLIFAKTGAGDTDWSYAPLIPNSSPTAVADIADPSSATTEDIANKVNDVLAVLRSGNIAIVS